MNGLLLPCLWGYSKALSFPYQIQLKQSHESLIEYATHYRNAYLDSQVNAKTVIQPEVMPEGIIHHVQNDSNPNTEDVALQGVPCKFIALEHLKSESDSDDNL